MRAHLRHEAAAKAKKAQEAERRRLAKLTEAEQKRARLHEKMSKARETNRDGMS